MKTVIDAVNEFEGECEGNYIYIGADKNKTNKGNLQETVTQINNTSWWLLCTSVKFLVTVAECETNFGKCITYAEYKTEYHVKKGDYNVR